MGINNYSTIGYGFIVKKCPFEGLKEKVFKLTQKSSVEIEVVSVGYSDYEAYLVGVKIHEANDYYDDSIDSFNSPTLEEIEAVKELREKLHEEGDVKWHFAFYRS